MKWYVLSAIVISGLNCMLAAIILSLATFHLFTDKSTNAPIAPNEVWISMVNGKAVFAAVWMFISLAGMWISMMRKRIWLTSVILGGFAICFGTSIYFTITFCSQLEMEDVKADTLFNLTFNEIAQANLKHQSKAWIPEWLDNIQKQSKSCCGIVTYRDYETFWPESPTKIPRTCCRDLSNATYSCPDDLNRVPFPNTPSDFIKVEIGCMEEINIAARHHVRESYDNSVMTNIFIGLATAAYLLLFVKRYLVGVAENDLGKWPPCGGMTNKDTTPNQGGGDIEALRSQTGQGYVPRQSLNVASSSQLVSAIDSIEGMQSGGSADSVLPMPIEQKNPLFVPQVNNINVNFEKPELVKPEYEKETQQQAPPPPPPPPKFNKANAAFAGIAKKNQQAEVAAGDDNMTVGGSNMGRKEVFIAQDAMDGGSRLNDGRNVQGSTSFDDVGDIIVPDQEGGSPPGSPNTKRRRRERKLGISRHRHHQ